MSKGKKRPVVISDSDESDENLDEEVLKIVATQAKKTKSEQHASSGSDSSDSDDEWQANGKPKSKIKKRKSAPARVAVKRMPREESMSSSPEQFAAALEEGELSEPTEQQPQLSLSSPSASDSDSEALEFDDGLDENMLGDAEDRRRLAEMTEAEREQELYMRVEKREAMRTRMEIKRRLKQAKKKEQRKDKLHSSRALRPKDKRKSEDKTRTKAIDELRATRQARKTVEQTTPRLPERYNAAELYASDENSESSDHNAAVDSDDDQDIREQSEPREVCFISTVEELAKVKLSRYRLEKWIHMPFFEDAIKGCFVRVGIGNHDGRPVYRIAEVVSVQETTKVYGLGSTKTNKGLKLKHALQERIFRIEYVSNSNFTSNEFERWKKEMEKADLPLPTTDAVEKKTKELEKAKSYEFTDKQIDQIIQEKDKFRKNPRNYAMTKNKLLGDLALAEQEGEGSKLEKIKQQLEDLEERAEELDKQRTKGLTAISYINERNRQNNLIRAEEALKEEFANKKETDDPFTRRKCMPTLVHLTKGEKASEEGKVEQPIGTEESKKETQQTSKPEHKMSVSSNADQDDLFSAHDFDIHIDLPTNSNGATSMTTPKLSRTTKEDASRRSLNLSDYKKRKGLI